jgi:hypothetical protein
VSDDAGFGLIFVRGVVMSHAARSLKWSTDLAGLRIVSRPAAARNTLVQCTPQTGRTVLYCEACVDGEVRAIWTRTVLWTAQTSDLVLLLAGQCARFIMETIGDAK